MCTADEKIQIIAYKFFPNNSEGGGGGPMLATPVVKAFKPVDLAWQLIKCNMTR